MTGRIESLPRKQKIDWAEFWFMFDRWHAEGRREPCPTCGVQEFHEADDWDVQKAQIQLMVEQEIA